MSWYTSATGTLFFDDPEKLKQLLQPAVAGAWMDERYRLLDETGALIGGKNAPSAVCADFQKLQIPYFTAYRNIGTTWSLLGLFDAASAGSMATADETTVHGRVVFRGYKVKVDMSLSEWAALRKLESPPEEEEAAFLWRDMVREKFCRAWATEWKSKSQKDT